MTPQVYLRKGKEESLMRRHPWIFSGAIDHIKACLLYTSDAADE